MGITSLSYLGFLLIALLLYYCIPGKVRWMSLVLLSVSYSMLSGNVILIIYPVLTIFVAWICTNQMEKLRTQKTKENETEINKKIKCMLYLALAASLGVLVVLKYLNLGVYTVNALAGIVANKSGTLSVLRWMAPVGVSFYTMSLMSYIFDVYYEIGKAEKNYFKLLLFGTYFPLLISGPIIRYKDMESRLFEPHRLEYENITAGAVRILWGFFKSLVISERLAIVVSEVFGNFDNYSGIYVALGMMCFTLQLYTNFSGSMDIIMGISKMLGIELPENFRQPFFSETIQEFWQRWHITLGAWLKDYVLYPVLRTGPFMELPKKLKDKHGKKKAKQYTTFLALGILWFISGLWHGGAWKYIWGTGILQCLYIIISEMTKPFFDKTHEKLNINIKSWWCVLLRRVRTFMLITVGFMFFNASSLRTGFRMLAGLFNTGGVNGFTNLGIDMLDWGVLAFALVLLLLVSWAQTKSSVIERLAGLNIVLRWGILILLILFVVVFGNYGPGYDAAEFIYQGF